MLRQRFAFLLALALACSGGLVFPHAWGQATDGQGVVAEPASMVADWPAWRWQTLAGDDALQLGLPGLAEGLYLGVLEANPDLGEEARAFIQVRLASAHIAQREFAEAASVLPPERGPNADAVALRRAILAYQGGNLTGVREALSRIRPANLSLADQPWYHLLTGMEARARGSQQLAVQSLDKALALSESLSPAQAAQIEAVKMRGDVVAGRNDPENLKMLQEKVKETRGSRAGFEFARQMAVVLDRMGRKDEAIAALRDQMTMLTDRETVEAGQILLLIGLISGRDSQRGQLAFREILSGKGDVATQRLALYLLAATAGSEDPAARDVFRQTLDELILLDNHALREEMLLLRSRLRVQAGELGAADQDVAEVINDYPASPLINDALWLRAYLAWNEGRYRSAVEFLSRIRDDMPPSRQRTRVGELIADCLFLKGDYAAAADFYGAVLLESRAPWMSEMLFYQTVLANALAGRWETAKSLLNTANGYPDTVIWQSEWNLLDNLRRAGKADEARERLQSLLNSARPLPTEDALRWRLQWLHARLAYDTGEADVAVADARSLAEEIETALSLGIESTPEIAPEVASHLRLLEGQALIRSGEPEAGIAVFEKLRSDYPGSDPAILSILEEARYFAGKYSLAEAQRRLRELADRYRDSPHAPAALYEAAIIADRQGLETNRRESLSILRDLIDRYPNHPLVFRARLLQGNIARQLGEFGDARVVYETVLREFPDHPEIYLAQLYRANTLLARSGDDPALLDEAAAGLESLLDASSVPVDVRVEAGYLLSRIQMQQRNRQRAAETLWLVFSQFLRDPATAAQLGANGRHWMARCLLDLGDILEQEGDIDDAREVYAQFNLHGLPGQNLAAARRDKLRQVGQ
ncbi:MAG: tetratricopeptide repeat protein [Puniceicoccales bacterium]